MSNNFSSFVAGVPEAVRRALQELQRSKVAKAGDTMTGQLTVDSASPNITLIPPDSATTEGGEIQFNGAGSYLPWAIDNNSGDLRFFREGSVRMRLGGDGDLGIYGPSSLPIATVERGTWTPTLTNFAVGTGGSATNTAAYTWVGSNLSSDDGILYMNGSITFGTSGATLPGSSGSVLILGLPSGFTIPSTAYSGTGPNALAGGVTYQDSSPAANYKGEVWYYSATFIRFVILNTSGTYPTVGGFTAATPFTWASGDKMNWTCVINAQRT